MKTKILKIFLNDFKNKSKIRKKKSILELPTIKNLRKYIESLNMIEYSDIRSLFDNNYNHIFFFKENKQPKNLTVFLEYSFLSLFYFISKPFLEITPEKIVLIIFCFRLKQNKINSNFDNKEKKILNTKNSPDKSISKIDKIKLKIISLILRRLFKKPLELEIIRLYYPYYETNIFMNLLNKTIKKIQIRKVLYKLFRKANIFKPSKLIHNKINRIPSFISGIKIRIAGRLMTQRIIPRKTVKIISRGSLAKGNMIHLEKGRIINKNKRGAFSITVTIGHLKYF
jgi:hypothetical protein